MSAQLDTDGRQPILLVEDDANDVLLVQRAFRKGNLVNPLQVARDGEQAVDYLAGRPPYADRQRFPRPVLILLDLQLPRKSGAEVLRWLRQQPALKTIPAIVLTPSKQAANLCRLEELGADSCLVKPVSFEALLSLARRLNFYWIILDDRKELAKI